MFINGSRKQGSILPLWVKELHTVKEFMRKASR